MPGNSISGRRKVTLDTSPFQMSSGPAYSLMKEASSAGAGSPVRSDYKACMPDRERKHSRAQHRAFTRQQVALLQSSFGDS